MLLLCLTSQWRLRGFQRESSAIIFVETTLNYGYNLMYVTQCPALSLTLERKINCLDEGLTNFKL